MKDSVKFSLILGVICLISAGLLAFIFDLAEPRIIEQKRLEEKRAIEEVLPKVPAEIEQIKEKDLIYYKAKDGEGNFIAYVFIAEKFGYSSDIRTVVSLDAEGKIIAVKVLEQSETPGIGSCILEEGFLNQFKNKDIHEKFDVITGATISSSTVIDSIKERANEVLKHGR